MLFTHTNKETADYHKMTRMKIMVGDRVKSVLLRSCEVSSRGRVRIPSSRASTASGAAREEKKHLWELRGGGAGMRRGGVLGLGEGARVLVG